MNRYRKKPVEIDAVHFDGGHQSVLAVMEFVDVGRATTEIRIHADEDPARSHVTIPTLEGDMRASAGDWIVRGVKGELYPVKPDIFAATYELAAAPDPLTVLQRIEEEPRYELAPGCPHCPDGHTPPDHGQPWGAYVGPERDGDGQPTTIHVARTAGAHVAESDAQWIYDVLNGRTR